MSIEYVKLHEKHRKIAKFVLLIWKIKKRRKAANICRNVYVSIRTYIKRI